MADDKLRRIVCRARTPLPGRDTGRSTNLPEEVLEEQIYRLEVLTGVIAGLWTLGLFVDFVLAPMVWRANMMMESVAVEVTGLVISFFMWGYVRFSGDTSRRKTDAGLAFLIWNAMGVAVLNTWVLPPPPEQTIHLSWITVGILVYAVIAPASPRKMLGGLAHRGVDGSAGAVARLSDGESRRVGPARDHPELAQLQLCLHRGAAGAPAAATRQAPA
jgi:hypothetical protein